MRIVPTDEHIVTPAVVDAWRRLDPEWQDLGFALPSRARRARLLDWGDGRIAAMDAVLSLTTPGVQNLAAEAAIRLSEASKDFRRWWRSHEVEPPAAGTKTLHAGRTQATYVHASFQSNDDSNPRLALMPGKLSNRTKRLIEA